MWAAQSPPRDAITYAPRREPTATLARGDPPHARVRFRDASARRPRGAAHTYSQPAWTAPIQSVLGGAASMAATPARGRAGGGGGGGARVDSGRGVAPEERLLVGRAAVREEEGGLAEWQSCVDRGAGLD